MTSSIAPLFLLALGVVVCSADDKSTPPPAKQPLSIQQLIERLDSNDFEVREEATRELVEHPDAVPALQKALRSDSTEVRNRAKRILDQFQARLTKLKAKQLLQRVKNGEVDQFIDQIVASPDATDDEVWQAVMELTHNLVAKARKTHHKNPSLLTVHTEGPGGMSYLASRRFATLDEIPIQGEFGWIDQRKLVAQRISSPGVISTCLVISQGPVQGFNRNGTILKESVLFANGDVSYCTPTKSGGIWDSVVYCDGLLEVDEVRKSVLIATGQIKIKEKIDKESIVIQNADNPLGLFKLYDTRQAGIEVEEKENGVRVKAVLEGKPFAKAGFKVGDQVLAVDGVKLTKREEFRKAVRRAAMANKEAVFKVQRPQSVVEIKVPLTDDPR